MFGLALMLASGFAHGQTPTAQAVDARSPVAQALSGPPDLQPPKAQACCLVTAGTPIEIELTELVTSRRATSGDKYTLKLAQDLTIGGVVVLRAGAPGRGEVVDAGPAGLAGRPGKLILAARWLDAGTVRVPLRSFHLAASGRDDSKAAMTFMSTPYVGVLAVFVHGGNIDYPPGTRAIAKVAADTFIPAPGPPDSSTPAVSQPPAPLQEKRP